jgi:hypothetical protein
MENQGAFVDLGTWYSSLQTTRAGTVLVARRSCLQHCDYVFRGNVGQFGDSSILVCAAVWSGTWIVTSPLSVKYVGIRICWYYLLGGRRSTAACLLRSLVRIPRGAWMFVCCVCCVLSGRGLCDEMITRPRGVLPTMARRCVWSGKLVSRGGHSPRWAAEPEKVIKFARWKRKVLVENSQSCKNRILWE